MADHGYLTRLRTCGGPSQDLLVALDQHRVMTTGQLARVTGTPVRTVRYRLDRLQQARLVDCVRPGRETGSAPRHWWLRPAGAKLVVTGTPAAQGHPTGMFVAHAAAITEVYLALRDHGPTLGISVVDWRSDRAAWQTWDPPRAWAYASRLTPDALATLDTGGGEVPVLIEVDLASMTQTLLRQKLARYLAYTADQAWRDTFDCCPPLLLATTTATRAATFTRTAERLLAQQPTARDTTDPASMLVVTACGLVRTPARGAVEPCWLPAQPAASELTLAEICAERQEAVVSRAYRHHVETVVRRREQVDALREMATASNLADLLASPEAAEAVRALVDQDPARFLDAEPDVAGALCVWWDARRRAGRLEARDLAQPLVTVLKAWHTGLWAGQARRLLASDADLRARTPQVHGLAEILADGHLVRPGDLAVLDQRPAHTWAEVQNAALGDYPAIRAAAVDARWRSLTRKARRHTDPTQLADVYDTEHLLICPTCTIAVVDAEADDLAGARCRYCDTDLLDWADRHQITTLDQRLRTIAQHLREV